MKFIHAADVHLDSPLHGLRRYEGAPVEELTGATRRAFSNLVELCLAEGVKFLLLAGDLYDGDWQDYNTGLFFVKEMGRLREAGVRVFLIRGNHDAASKITKGLRLPENVHCFETQSAGTVVVEEAGVALHGQSFATPAVVENLALGYPKAIRGLFNIGLLHTSAGGRPGHENYAPCSLPDLAGRGYQYWALGHVHEREVLAADGPWVVFPGNVQGRQIREAGEKGCTLVTVTDGVVRLEHRTLDVLRWARVEIAAAPGGTSEELLEQARVALAAEQLAAGERLLAARVTFSGESAGHAALMAHPEAFEAEVRALGTDLGQVWIEKVEMKTRAPIDLKMLAEQCDPLGDLVRYFRGLPEQVGEMAELEQEWEALKKALPEKVAASMEEEGRVSMHALLADVEQLLLPRLVPGTNGR